MQTLRLTFLALLLLVVSALTAHAQLVAGSSLFFDHDIASAEYVAGYDLCVDVVSDAACKPIGTVRVYPGEEVLKVTIPDTAAKGKHELYIRARWKEPLTGANATNGLAQVIVGGPMRLRTTEAVTP